MDTRRLKKKIKLLERRLYGAPRTWLVRMQDHLREARARNRQARGLMPQSIRLEIHGARHDAEVRSKKHG